MTHTPGTRKPVSRRRFLRIAALTVGASAVACCGLTYVASQVQPKSQSQPAAVDTPSYIFDKGATMNQRILVTYATRTGSTVGVAEAIAQTLGDRGFTVDMKPVKENPSLEDYHGVVIGSAVNGYQWLPEAVDFVKAHQQALAQLPVALFCVHALNLGDSERSKKNKRSYLNAVRPLVNPAFEAYFAGLCGKPEDTSAIMRWFARTFMDSGEGDCRDFSKIRAWAGDIDL